MPSRAAAVLLGAAIALTAVAPAAGAKTRIPGVSIAVAEHDRGRVLLRRAGRVPGTATRPASPRRCPCEYTAGSPPRSACVPACTA
jgi:hypothetical protein